MSGSTFGDHFTLTTFGESHGTAIGGVVQGVPAGIAISIEQIQRALDRRKPGQSEITTERKESDTVELLSGVMGGVSLGSPIGFVIRNADQRSEDYNALKDVYRPSHADYTFQHKYGVRDHRGGGRSSARETACRVVGGAIAAQVLADSGISVTAFVRSVGGISMSKHYTEVDLSSVDSNEVRCPEQLTAESMINEIKKAKEDGDSLGGTIQCVVTGCPVGLGEPVFDKLHAVLAQAIVSINAVKGIEFGSGFSGSSMRGSAHNDAFEMQDDQVRTRTNNSGGVQGGISNGEDIYFNVAFKPTATIASKQDTVNKGGEEVELEAKGRHDPCVLPRAVPIVEGMTWMVLADMWLRNQTSKLS